MAKNMVIWKYPFDIDDVVSIKIPADHKILSIQSQGGTLTAWVIVDPQSQKVEKKIYVYGTGHPINPEGKTFISTVQMGGLVWHVF